MSSESTTTLELPTRTVTAVETVLDGTEFDSPAEYVAFVLDEVLYHADTEAGTGQEVDEQQVQERLKSLGYLNE